jgi:20S proteasome subunit alpha 7
MFAWLPWQYDLYTTSYSPDGRVFQVEYAAKAVESSGTAVGVRCKDGVVLGFEKLVVSKMLVEVRSRARAQTDTAAHARTRTRTRARCARGC